VLGRGAVAVVYKARQRGVERVVALKLLAAEGFHDLQRFQRECQTLSKLDHPAIVHVYAWGATPDGTQYLALEYVEGRTLDAVIAERGAMPVDQVVAIATKLCAGLTYAHEQGVVHRDIKPANIMLLEDGGVKLLDFGLAKFLGSDLRVTRTEAIVGSPVYMAPEQFMSKQVGPSSDVYGLACTLYEALSGRVAFGGESPFEIFNLHSAGQYDPLPDTIPARVRGALDKALHPDAARRFASAADFMRALNGDDPSATAG
jgi:serine/threonine protein kinase